MSVKDRDVWPFSVHHPRQYMMLICLITGDGNLDYLVKEVTARFLHCKAPIFPFPYNSLEASH